MAHEGLAEVKLYKGKSQCISQGNQVGFVQILKPLMILFIFWMENLFVVSLLVLILIG